MVILSILLYNRVYLKKIEEGDEMKKNNNVFTLDLLVLSVLKRSDNYGYGISSIIFEESIGNIIIKEGVLYPILYKLQIENKISSYEVIVNRRIRVYYHIEQLGLDELNLLVDDFLKSFDAIKRIIEKE